jgi:hypothetical protein
VRMQETAIETFREIIVKESHQISEFRILIDMRSTGESRQSSPDNITVGIGSDMSEETRETGQELIDGEKEAQQKSQELRKWSPHVETKTENMNSNDDHWATGATDFHCIQQSDNIGNVYDTSFGVLEFARVNQLETETAMNTMTDGWLEDAVQGSRRFRAS